MTQTDRSTLTTNDEAQLYSEAWNEILTQYADLLASLLEIKVRDLHPNRVIDREKVKDFLSQYPPKPPPVRTAVQTTTKPVNFLFNGGLYEMGVDKKPINSWASCWLRFCYVLKETLNDYGKFREVLSYRSGSPPFSEDDKRWKISDQIEGTNIYVHTGKDAKTIKEEMELLAKYFGYDPPTIKEVDKQSTRNLKPKRPE